MSGTCVHPGGVKTNIAASGRVSASISNVTGGDAEQGRKDFEKLFRTTAEEAAHAILTGVRKNSRRVLIGLDAHAAGRMQRLLPSSYQALVKIGLGLVKR